jgi:OFA family oxalate/formate antiporter-like MFS transporter
MQGNVPNRWRIAAAGVAMQIALGAVYAWSVFRKPLSDHFDTSVSKVNIIFSLAILFLGFAAYFGGRWMGKVGPRKVGMAAGILYGVGIILASFSSSSIVLLYLTYGVIAGTGIGLGYIVPVATLIKWFPDRRGFITGIAVAGFGAGALVTAPIAERLIEGPGLFETFAILGVVYLVVVTAAAATLSNPPEGWKPEGWEPDTTERADRSGADYELGGSEGAIRTWQWWALWSLLFLNVTAGISLISEASPIAQEVTGVGAATAAGLVSIISISNGAGRFLWAWLSDAIGRKWVFLTMFLLQAALFAIMPSVGAYALFAVLAFVVISCYGGGFGTMPAFAADYFGSKNVGQVYGAMLTAWGIAGVVGPLLISAIKDSTGEYTNAFYIIAGIMLLSAIVPFLVRPPDGKERGEEGELPEQRRFQRDGAGATTGERTGTRS